MSAVYERIAALHLAPLWRHSADLLPLAPKPAAIAGRWRYSDVRAALDDASAVISSEEADRRVLLLLNPGFQGAIGTTATLLAGVQMLLPGERARAHRHTAAVVRFIIDGHGAHTVTDGQRIAMDPGDLLITPSWAWHDHGSEDPEPVIWLDGLDLPLVRALEVGFFELYPEPRQPVKATSAPVLKYPWQKMRDGLDATTATAGGATERTDMSTINYERGPGGPVTPTLGCRAHKLSGGQTSRRRRETASSIFYVISGDGTSMIGDAELSWSEGDIFVVPAWAEVQHANDNRARPAYLFSITDEPALRSLGLYRSARA